MFWFGYLTPLTPYFGAAPIASHFASAMKNIKGTFDILPFDYAVSGSKTFASSAWYFVEKTLRTVFERYDFQEIRTPILEPTELIARGVGESTDIVSKEMFAFQKEDTHYVLRPELTAPVMRAYLQHRIDQQGGTARLFYLGACFRAERPQKGRFRQFHQFGAEVIGNQSPETDADLIAAMMACYQAFGIQNFRLRLNSLGTVEERISFKQALQTYLEPYRAQLSETSQMRLDKNPLRILDTKSEQEQALLENAPLLTDFLGADSRAYYEKLKSLLSALSVDFVEDPKLVRGLDYYMHTAFELEGGDLGGQNALAGGGRYDGLATDIGAKQPVPAIGFAAGMERLFIALDALAFNFPEQAKPLVFLIGLGDAAKSRIFTLLQELRIANIHAATDFAGRSMKAQMREADRKMAQYTLILGDTELEQNAVVLKNMVEGSQQTLSLDALIPFLQQHA